MGYRSDVKLIVRLESYKEYRNIIKEDIFDNKTILKNYYDKEDYILLEAEQIK
jgi:adenylosuccinate synthase